MNECKKTVGGRNGFYFRERNARNSPVVCRCGRIHGLVLPSGRDGKGLGGQCAESRLRQDYYWRFLEKNVFDHDRLSFYVRQLPNGYECKPITSALYKTVLREAWSEDLCSQFTDEADYEKRGLGFALLHQGRVVCGASSYTVFRGGIEIEIDTHPDFRRKGLAKACSARLILECLDRGLYPSWDAANRASLSLAEALGYHFDKAYVAYVVPREMWQVATGGTGEEKKKNGQQRR